MENTLSNICTPGAYQAANAHLFPSRESLRWYFRTHKAELAERGALLLINGRHQVHAERMGAAVIELGKLAAQRKAVPA